MWVAKISQFSIPPHGTSYSTPWNKLFHPMEQSVPPHGTKYSTPWNKQEGAAFVGRRCRLPLEGLLLCEER